MPGSDYAVGNLTNGVEYIVHHSPYPSVWSLIKDRINDLVSKALRSANTHLTYSSTQMGNFKERLEGLLGDPLDHVAAGHPEGQGNFTIHKDVKGVVEGAVNEVMMELNMTETSNSSSTSFKQELIKKLDDDIEMNVMSKVLQNASGMLDDQDKDFFHKMPIKDETMFVALVCMGIIVPVIFITLFLTFFYKRRKENEERRQEMLLKEQPEFSMDEYNTDGKNYDDDVPDLDLKNLRV